MRAGELDQLLTFQKRTKTRNSFGDQVETWPTDFEVLGTFEPIGSALFPETWKRFSESTARFLVRYPTPAKIEVALHRIVLVRDATSPVETTTWEIFPPYAVSGKPFMVYIEASEVK